MFTYISYTSHSQTPSLSNNKHCKTPSCTIGTQYINTQDILKDCPLRTSQESRRATRTSQPKNMSFTPDTKTLKLHTLQFEKIEKLQKYLVFNKKPRTNRSSVPPQLKLAELKPDFPRPDGNSLIVHQYALPQALIPIRTPSPSSKVPNILEDKVVPRQHPIIRKGVSGWKISLSKLWKGVKRRKVIMIN